MSVPHWGELRSSPDPTRTPRPAHIVRPDQVTTFDDLVEALAYLRRAGGTQTLKELAERDGRLPPSTTSDLLRRKTRRPRREVVLAFAQACGESTATLREWAEAWSRARHAPAQTSRRGFSRARRDHAESQGKVRYRTGSEPSEQDITRMTKCRLYVR